MQNDDTTTATDDDVRGIGRYGKMAAAAVGLLVIGALAGGAIGDDSPSDGPTAATSVTATEQTATPAASGTGDYSSVADYRAELVDSGDKLSKVFDAIARGAGMVADGEMTGPQFGAIAEEAADTTATHRRFFEQRTAPDEYRDLNDEFVEVVRTFERAFELAAQCGYDYDMAACERSVELQRRATERLEALTDTL